MATALEYGCFPISSELLFPVLGFAVFVGGKSLPLAILAATAGAVVGCSGCYGVARFFGGFLRWLGKKSRALNEAMAAAEGLLKKYGCGALCFGRLVPLVRTYISFPAGFGKMPFGFFVLSSAVGALIWNTVLFSVGYFCAIYGKNHTKVLQYYWVIPVAVICVYIFKKWKKRQR